MPNLRRHGGPRFHEHAEGSRVEHRTTKFALKPGAVSVESDRAMRKFAICLLLVALLTGSGIPAYARRHHHHVNKEARAAQKRNKARAKQLKKDARERQKSRPQRPQQ